MTRFHSFKYSGAFHFYIIPSANAVAEDIALADLQKQALEHNPLIKSGDFN